MKYFSYLKKRFATRNAKRIKRIETGNFITFCPYTSLFWNNGQSKREF